MKKQLIIFFILTFILIPLTIEASFAVCVPTGAPSPLSCPPVCTDQDYDCTWGECVHGQQEGDCEANISCRGYQSITKTRDCSPSICQESSYTIKWSDCVKDEQYSSFVKNEKCIDGFTPLTQKDCIIPEPLPACQELSFDYGDWTPCVDNVYFRVILKNEECVNGFNPPTQKDCQISESTQSTITPIVLNSQIDTKIITRLKGRILLQVEEHGEAYYVNPKDSQMYYMADGNNAYRIMKYLGVGITNSDLDKVMVDKNFAKKHSGKIFLQIEEHGEAYYIDVDGNAHYLKDGIAAYTIMRELGLGITNNDLNKIPEGNL